MLQTRSPEQQEILEGIEQIAAEVEQIAAKTKTNYEAKYGKFDWADLDLNLLWSEKKVFFGVKYPDISPEMKTIISRNVLARRAEKLNLAIAAGQLDQATALSRLKQLDADIEALNKWLDQPDEIEQEPITLEE